MRGVHLIRLGTVLSIILFGMTSMLGSGDLTVTGTSWIDGAEAKLVRIAIDSAINLPTLGLLGTGDGDGNVTASEVDAYIARALSTGLVDVAFKNGIVKVSEDDVNVPITLDSIGLEKAEGNTTSDATIGLTFKAGFDLKFDQKTDHHRISMTISFSNVSYNLSFEVPNGWNIETVTGLKSAKVVNDNEVSKVSGQGLGDGTVVTVNIKKEGDVCGLFLIIGILILILLMVMLWRQRKRKRQEQEALSRTEYAVIGPTEGKGAETGSPEKRLGPEERTFGKEYFTEGERKNKDR
jgi:hypothetical protein